MTESTFLSLDLVPLLVTLLSSIGCAAIGNLLVLRRLSLMGDAIAHAVLPGLVAAFILTGSRDPLTMLLGATLSGLCAALVISTVQRLIRVDPSAVMGAIFSIFFAGGVVMLEAFGARNVDLDAECVLFGQVETLFWLTPEGVSRWSSAGLAAIPSALWLAVGTVASVLLLLRILNKEILFAAFDPAGASALGFPAQALHILTMVALALVAVASFEAVGSILVIANLICPPATARLFTDRYRVQKRLSVAFACLNALIGYALATALPSVIGIPALPVAGTIAVFSGVTFALAWLSAPRYGYLTSRFADRAHSTQVALDDLLAALYRLNERGVTDTSAAMLNATLGPSVLNRIRPLATKRRLIHEHNGFIHLTDHGREAALVIVRRHRLWENYLYSEASIPPDAVHRGAEALEHLELNPPRSSARDPHGREIP